MRISLPAALAASLCAAPALAQVNISTYTDVNLTECSIVSTDDMGTTWTCAGYKGIPVMIAEGDLRFFVSYGLKSTEEKAASQTLPPFNHLGEKIEWRLGKASGELKPVATILRYFVSQDEGKPDGEVLVVTKFAPGATCHVAYIDALANPDANVMAQKAADETAPEFDCAKDPETIGTFKAW
ncbi:MAG TPA: hypothetical protein PK286_05180 [Devosia sp.]|nr:hypothetical protein [Devosia sp.]